jgi:hypothetical protein
MLQSGEVLLGETIFLITPLVQVHAVVIRAIDTTQERHAVLSRTIARTHDLVATARGGRTIDCSNAASSVFFAVICDV